MNITIKKQYMVVFIAVQLILAICAGIIVLGFTNRNATTPDTYLEGVDIGSLDRDKAIQKAQKYFDGIISNGVLSITYNDSVFNISYKEIDAKIDYNATMEIVKGKNTSESFINIINGYFISKDRRISPVVNFNEEKLRKKLQELASKVNRDPVNANISFKGGKITKTPEIIGIKLNIDNAVEKFKKDLSQKFEGPIVFNTVDGQVIETSFPDIMLRDLENIKDIIGSYSTEIKDPENEDSAKLAAYAINKVLVCQEDKKNGKKAGVFSFNKYINMEKGLLDKNNEGYNQVVSTLYAAVKNAGIKDESIVRTENKTKVNYIDKQFSTAVLGSTVDFIFKNTLKNPIIIFAEVKDSKMTITIVGMK